MRAVRAERVVLGVVGVILLFFVVCPPCEYRGRWLHLWLGEALREQGPAGDVDFARWPLLTELAVLGAAVGVSLLTGWFSRRRSGVLRLTRSDRVLVIAILVVVLLFLFPPFRVEKEGSWAEDEYVGWKCHVAYRMVITPPGGSDECSDVYLELLAGEVAVVVVVAAVLMVVLREKRATTPEP